MPNINKIIFGADVLIDLTQDTATAADVAQGFTFHDASGTARTGTKTGGGSGTLPVTANGTYNCYQYASVSVALPVYDGTVV